MLVARRVPLVPETANMPHDDLQQVAQSFATRIPPLEAQLARLVQSVPEGSVVTYGDLAEALGDTVASRWVATVLLEPDGPLAEFSHRVVRVSGEVGLYHTGDPRQKRARLQAEGVDVHGGKVNLRRHRFTLAAPPRPLTKLKQWQMSFTPPALAPLPLEKVQIIGVSMSLMPAAWGWRCAAATRPMAAHAWSPFSSSGQPRSLTSRGICPSAKFPFILNCWA